MRSTKRKTEAGDPVSSRRSRASTKNLGDTVEIRIRDNGTGIPPDVKDKMFNPFFTTKPAGEGTGLGLSMSHDIIVKQHGGSIDVDTEPGQFTEFIIVLPRASNSARHRIEVRRERSGSCGRRRTRRRGAVPPAVPARSARATFRDGLCRCRRRTRWRALPAPSSSR